MDAPIGWHPCACAPCTFASTLIVRPLLLHDVMPGALIAAHAVLSASAGRVGVYQTETFRGLRTAAPELDQSCIGLEALLRCALSAVGWLHFQKTLMLLMCNVLCL
jgi:hypothetical protein